MSVANVKNIKVHIYEKLLNDSLRNQLIAKDKKFFISLMQISKAIVIIATSLRN